MEYKAVEKPYQVGFTVATEYILMIVEIARFMKDNLEPTTKYELKVSAQNQMFTGNSTVIYVYTKPLQSKTLLIDFMN